MNTTLKCRCLWLAKNHTYQKSSSFLDSNSETIFNEWHEWTHDFLILDMFRNYLRGVPAVAQIVGYDTDQLRHATPENVARYRDVRIIIWDNGNEIAEFRTWRELTEHWECIPELKQAFNQGFIIEDIQSMEPRS